MSRDKRPSPSKFIQAGMRWFFAHQMARADLPEFEPPESMRSAPTPVCPGCEYDLSGLEPVGECPECGAGYFPLGLERAHTRRDQRRKDAWWVTVFLLCAMDLVATVSYALIAVFSGMHRGKLAFLVMFKLLLADAFVILILTILAKGRGNATIGRAIVMSRWAFWGGLIGIASLTLLIMPQFRNSLIEFYGFALCTGVAGLLGWAKHDIGVLTEKLDNLGPNRKP